MSFQVKPSSPSYQSMINLLDQLLSVPDHFSPSIYDVAACAFHPGINQSACQQWLIAQQNPDGSWGETFSWQYRYLCTYSASVALWASSYHDHAERAIALLSSIPDTFPDCWTINFGGHIAAVDAYAAECIDLHVIHPAIVQNDIAYDRAKWEKIVKHPIFYDPTISLAGYFAEWSFVMPSIDIERVIENFQVANGSLSHSPASSVFGLMVGQRKGIRGPFIERLAVYVESLNPYHQDICTLDQAPFFVTGWLLLFMDHRANPIPNLESVAALRKALSQHGRLLSAAGESTFPGDVDTTACAIVGLDLPPEERAAIMGGFTDMFADDHYLTFRFERTPSVTTNVHAAAAWPEGPHTPAILDWIAAEMAKTDDLPQCKWHISPYYTLGEIARLFPALPHDRAHSLARRAGEVFLRDQRPSGGWGWRAETCEETCYALLALDMLRQYNLIEPHAINRALESGLRFLQNQSPDYSPLWIGKSLYYVRPLERWLRALALGIVPYATEPISVLYVDDNPSYQTIFQAQLSYQDYDLTVCADAESALDYLGRTHHDDQPDVVVIDLRLPGMDGYQAAQQIQKLKLDCRIVATTAYYDVETQRRVHSHGFHAYLEKPFDPVLLNATLSSLARRERYAHP